jgi:uncharacterized phage protein (TIGR01671 family)
MNRKFKFRVWDIKDQVFCYIDNLNFSTGDSKSRQLDGIPRYVGNLNSNNDYFYKTGLNTLPIYNSINEKNRYIIQQFTGLFDSDKKEIYEGDILAVFEYDSNFTNLMYNVEIVFDEEDAQFAAKESNKPYTLLIGNSSFVDINVCHCKVKGNIFETIKEISPKLQIK